jgi:hypothetical protein
VQQREAGDGAGHAGGEVSHGGTTRNHLPVGVEVHVARGGRGRRLAEVDRGGAAIGQPQHGEAAATEVARAWIDDGERKARGHHGIGGIAAVLHHVHPDLGCEAVGRGHHAVLGLGRRALRERGRGRQQQQQRYEEACVCGAPGARGLSQGRILPAVARGTACDSRETRARAAMPVRYEFPPPTT